MAILLGVAQIVLQQAQSPDLVGGGDVVIRVGRQIPASLLLAGTLQADALRTRIATAAPTADRGPLSVAAADKRIRVAATRRGPEPRARARRPRDERRRRVARHRGRPRVDAQRSRRRRCARSTGSTRLPTRRRGPTRGPSGSTSTAAPADARFYLTFLVGPRTPDGRRAAGVRLQLQRGDRTENYDTSALLTDADVATRARPDHRRELACASTAAATASTSISTGAGGARVRWAT